MKVLICALTFLLLFSDLTAQIIISGKVLDQKQMPLPGANVFLQGSYDGMLVSTPYMSKMPDMPTRGRFSPMLFSGTLFSTGAYSAEYGQALSSIVDMKTNSIETEEKSGVSVMTVGVMGSATKCWAKGSLSLSGDYVNSGLYNVTSPAIFTTAYEEYAIKACKVNSVDYLLKPFAYLELEAAFQKFGDRVRHSQLTPAVTIELLNKMKDMLRKQYKTRFVIKVGEHLKSIAVEDILFFTASKRLLSCVPLKKTG